MRDRPLWLIRIEDSLFSCINQPTSEDEEKILKLMKDSTRDNHNFASPSMLGFFSFSPLLSFLPFALALPSSMPLIHSPDLVHRGITAWP